MGNHSLAALDEVPQIAAALFAQFPGHVIEHKDIVFSPDVGRIFLFKSARIFHLSHRRVKTWLDYAG